MAKQSPLLRPGQPEYGQGAQRGRGLSLPPPEGPQGRLTDPRGHRGPGSQGGAGLAREALRAGHTRGAGVQRTCRSEPGGAAACPAPATRWPQADVEICPWVLPLSTGGGAWLMASAIRGHAPRLPAGLSVRRHPVPTLPGPARCMHDTRNCLAPRNNTAGKRTILETLRLPRRVGSESDRKFPHYTLNTYMNSQGLDSGSGWEERDKHLSQTRVMPVSESFHVNGLILCGHPELGPPGGRGAPHI